MTQDKYSQGGRYAPHRYGNHAYQPIINESGPSLGCVTIMLVVLTLVIYYAVYVY